MLEITPLDFLAKFCPQEVALRLPDLLPDNHCTGPLECQEGYGDTAACAHEEGIILACLAHKLGGPVLEIGAASGVSTRYIHDGLARLKKGSPIYSVDINHLWRRCDDGWPLRVRIDGDASDYTPPEPCTWAFVDGNHSYSYVLKDIANALRAGCRHIIFHDTAPWNQRPHNPAETNEGHCEARAAVLAGLAPNPHFQLFDIMSPQGMIFATPR